METPLHPEILAPVGDLEMAYAAVHAGADAIYVGAPGANARARAAPLTDSEFEELLTLCRLYGVKSYLALNTLLFEEEIPQLVEKMKKWAGWQMDGWIVQDWGVALLAHHLFPEQPLHASTQMTLASAEAIELVCPLGIVRSVLARELSIEEIARLHRTLEERGIAQKLEVFVHGALCISYSGQCHASQSFGGRSANRGECAQSCRLQYELLVDGKPQSEKSWSSPLSTHDLCGLEQLEPLMAAGVSAFKIEGRLKTAEYVAAAVSAYRQQLFEKSSSQQSRSLLSRIFSRGFGTGWLLGKNHKELITGVTSGHVGEALGEVIALQRDRILLSSETELSAGEGILLLDRASGEKWGGKIHEVILQRDGVWLRMEPCKELTAVKPGWNAYANSNPHLERALRRQRESREERRRIAVDWIATVHVGKPLQLELNDQSGNRIVVADEQPLAPQQKEGSLDWVAEELRKLAEPWSASQIELEQQGNPFVPRSQLRALKQLALEELKQKRTAPPRPTQHHAATLESLFQQLRVTPDRVDGEDSTPQLHLLLRSAEQLRAAQELDVASITLDLPHESQLVRAMELLKGTKIPVGIATPRIFKQGEEEMLNRLVSCSPAHLLVRNLGALQLLKNQKIPLWGDYSLNVANSLSAAWLLQLGLSRLTPSIELDDPQLLALLDSTLLSARQFELPLQLKTPLFHTEHCLYADRLGKGGTPATCGKPCLRHQIDLKDQKGEIHTLLRDLHCRNTLYRGAAKNNAHLISALRRRGVHHFRIEFVGESADQVIEKVRKLQQLFKT